MRGWTFYLIGGLFLALAYWSFSTDGLNGTTILFGVFSLFLFFRGASGHEASSVDDVTAPLDFVQDPAGAIVDAAVDKVGELWSARDGKDDRGIVATAVGRVEELLSVDGEKSAQGAPFDPDAVIERYLANRPEPVPEPAAPPRPRFGRKGL